MSILESLTDRQIEELIASHWREIKGLLNEQKRRKQTVPKPDGKPLDFRRRN